MTLRLDEWEWYTDTSERFNQSFYLYLYIKTGWSAHLYPYTIPVRRIPKSYFGWFCFYIYFIVYSWITAIMSLLLLPSVHRTCALLRIWVCYVWMCRVKSQPLCHFCCCLFSNSCHKQNIAQLVCWQLSLPCKNTVKNFLLVSFCTSRSTNFYSHHVTVFLQS